MDNCDFFVVHAPTVVACNLNGTRAVVKGDDNSAVSAM